MSTNNKVFQVLVTKGNLAPLAKGGAISGLAVGQIGFFDTDTNLAIDGTGVVSRSFYAAVGIGTTGSPITDIFTSAGQEIQTRNIHALTTSKYKVGQPTIIEMSDFVGKCDEDYSLKVESRSMDIINIKGFTPYFRTYNVHTSCCVGCAPCPSGSKAEVAGLLVNRVNEDKDAFVKAELLDETGAVVTNVDTYLANAANKDKAVKIRLTSLPKLAKDLQGGPKIIRGFDGTAVSAFLSAGFECNGKVVVTQEGKQAQGAGNFIQAKEYVAGGYNGNYSIYRTAGTFNESFPTGTILADAGTNYNQVNLVYDQFSRAGWGEYLNQLNTLFAIPATDTVTYTGILAVLNKITGEAGLEPIAVATEAGAEGQG